MRDWTALNGEPPLNHSTVNVASLDSYLTGSPVEPALREQAWKDTVSVYPDEIVTIRVRFARQDGSNFGFDATAGPGYVWHCHLLPHEDNEMMRPYVVIASEQGVWVWWILAGGVIVVILILSLAIYRYRRKNRKQSNKE